MKEKNVTAKSLFEKAQKVTEIQSKIEALYAEKQTAEQDQAQSATVFFTVPENVQDAHLVENDGGVFALQYDASSPVMTKITRLKK